MTAQTRLRACRHCHRAIQWSELFGAWLHTVNGRRACPRASIRQAETKAEPAEL